MKFYTYQLLKTGHRILVAMLSAHPRPLGCGEIARISNVSHGTTAREILRLDNAGYIVAAGGAMYKLTDAGSAAAKAPCPVRVLRPAEATKGPAPVPVSTAALESRITAPEYIMLRYIAEHPGWTIAQIAEGMGRTVQPTRDTINRLRLHGLLTLPAGRGAALVPTLTPEGAARAAKPDVKRRGYTQVPHAIVHVAVTGTQMPILHALLMRDGVAMSIPALAKAASMTVQAVERHVVHLAREGYVAHPDDAPSKVGLTEKGQRMASGDLNFAAPRPAAPVPSPQKVTAAPPPVVAPPLDSLVPPALLMRGGIRHPPIPKPAERPRGVKASDWQRVTLPEASSLHDACARGLA